MMRLFGIGRRRSIWFLGVEWVLGIQYNVRNLLLVVHNCMHLYIYHVGSGLKKNHGVGLCGIRRLKKSRYVHARYLRVVV